MTAATESPAVFALRELIVCWDQGYEALARGDLDRVDALMAIAEERLEAARRGGDLPGDLLLEAASARARLEHGMRAGLDGLRDELSRARHGERALRGYGSAHRTVDLPSGRIS
ncbi:MAG: hypothetical protein RL398_378 [Planctomycetota bacterium]|jgi:hypothetical protein